MNTARQLADSESGMTAVIEFLTAFVLFLIILTAFFSLAGLQLGANHPTTDQLDDYALQSLDKLTGNEGWYTPNDIYGERDVANATSEWQIYNATELLDGAVQPGLAGDLGQLDTVKLAGLKNVTQDQFIRGLGLPSWASINLTIRVSESDDSNRIGLFLFQDGASRNASANSAVAHRLMMLDSEKIEIILEVHDAGRTPTDLVITEFMAEPELGYPEWVEVQNRDGFAANLTGWGLGRASSGGVHTLVGNGALAGGDVMLLSGKPSLQENQGAEVILDLGQSGILGLGAINGLNKFEDTLTLTWTYPGRAQTYDTMAVNWVSNWNIDEDIALDWLEGEPSESASWQRNFGGTPGLL
ncbi:MAG: lamin tail domain-containing protein [Euryarchaeota archaeon]|nr:lamin tail domain-containing protein [Euryarchaeota archaeon]